MRNKVLIIAEAGVNHNGDLNTAKRLIDVAAEAQADYVKFQTFKADSIVSHDAQKATYQQRNFADNDQSQLSMLKKLELSYEDHHVLKEYCQKRSIGFLSTGFDLESIDFLHSLNIPFFKIPSGEITNKPLLEHIASKQKPVVMSTGMADINEIRDALLVLTTGGLDKHSITILHCNSEYPTPFEDVNLGAMQHIQSEFNIKIGYSDHTLGIEVPVAAVALGARVIEKHFTLDRKMDGPDHAASLEPNEFQQMVSSIRIVEKALSGTGKKTPSFSEQKNIEVSRKSLYLAREMKSGDEIGKGDLLVLRPGDGISPMRIDEVISKKLNRSLNKYSKLKWEDFTS